MRKLKDDRHEKVWIVAVLALAAGVRPHGGYFRDGVESVEVRSLGVSRSLVEVFVRASNASGAAVSIVRADLTLDRGETTLLRASVDERSGCLPVGGGDGPHSGGNTF
ncbi:MAG: hypothetical protein ACLR76_10760 [Alistipes sp.]